MALRALEEFKGIAQRFHSTYYLVNEGLSDLSKNILISHNKTERDDFIIKDEDGEVVLSVPYSHTMKGLVNDGSISQLVAQGILNWVYTAWNDCYREKIAIELGVGINSVMSDVMGDIRILRNAISHEFGHISEADKKNLKN